MHITHTLTLAKRHAYMCACECVNVCLCVCARPCPRVSAEVARCRLMHVYLRGIHLVSIGRPLPFTEPAFSQSLRALTVEFTAQ